MTWLLALVSVVATSLVAFDAVAAAATPEGPFDVRLLVTYGWVVGIAGIGGLASFHGKVRRGEARWVNLHEVIGELFTSALVGLITFWLCRASGTNEYIGAALIGIAGHMGSRAMFLLEKMLERWFGKWLTPLPIDTTPAPLDPK